MPLTPVNAAGGGTVTSVNVSGGATGLIASGGPVVGSGTITLGGTLNAATSINWSALQKTLPGSAGVAWNNGGVVSIS